ncbi:c-type cytochrome biogenesis protein CcmI [Rhodoblastus acidophilus]|uniref:C-type cytochrome biogenesis protein CcmI n=1 Tax=Rhodoblastus acidophilus TaxID=1074 RepID=A0A6N8DH72_RHOAC|nr:c-type cytochrome biogenesis protein CcmI [Rhodoblastus acidophilus]MCW2272779.1 cytochrome c-type biogenesis protein CcmH [Rhodoblastus acidophilus]MTV29690.1 c-type cytochrome biogenesis protein CcmI [Rhodoblastus acidophilus]
MIWIVFALLTGAAVLSALWPLSRSAAAATEDAADVAFYRAQIAEIDAERERGAIAPDQAETAKAQAARRLLASAPQEAAAPASNAHRKTAAALALVLIPLVSVGLYLRTGDPEQPDMPLTARLNAPMQNDFMVVVAKMEGHLAAHPDDGKALELMAPVWMRMGNAERALAARKDVIRLLGETADRRIRLAEAMANANNGAFPPEAYDSINRAMELEPKSPEVRYFAGAAAAQKGEFERARAVWKALAADLPENSPPRKAVEEQIAELDSKGPIAQRADTAQAPANPQNDMIRSMVEQLAARLQEKGGTVDEWERLIRSYAVLKEAAKAKGALADARKALAQDAQAREKIDAQAKELGLDK